MKIIQTTSAALFLLAIGILTSVSILTIQQIVFLVPLIYFLYQSIKNKSFLKVPKSTIFLFGFILVAMISLLLNLENVPNPSKNFGRLRYYFVGATSMIVLAPWIRESSDQIKRLLLNTFFSSIIISGLFAIYSFVTFSQERARGLTDTLRYGYGSSMILILILGCILHQEKLNKLINVKLGIAAFIIGFIGMYLTYTRGALFAFISALPFVLYFYKRKIGLTLGAIALFCSFGLVGNYLFGSGNYNSRFLINKNNQSDHIRRSQWQAAIIATKEKPILGWGFSNFHSQLKRIKEQHDLNAKDYNNAHAHNLFLEVSSGTGLIGLITFLAWILVWAWETWNSHELVRKIIFPVGITWIIASQFEMTLDSNTSSFIFFIYSFSTIFYEDEKVLIE